MNHTKLQEPSLRDIELPCYNFSYPIYKIHYLNYPDKSINRSFVDVMEHRESRREFNRLSIEHLSSLLWYVSQNRASYREKSGFLWQHRSYPSAGGRHPIDIFVINPTDIDGFCFYDPISHALCEIENAYTDEMISMINNVINIGNGTIFWLIAQTDRTMSKYKNGESLIWRDTGVLLATISFFAEAINLNCCTFGITGDRYIPKIFPNQDVLWGVGGCIVGEKSNKDS